VSERIGIFGGSFDPPHVGHLILAGEAVDFLKLDQLLWILTPDPPHKTELSLADWQHRLAMLESCLVDNPQFEISRIDIDRPAPHYAVDTMHILSSQYPSDELIYIMGGDSLRDLPDWHKPLEFVQACHSIGVMHRPGDQIDLEKLEFVLPGLKSKVQFMEAPLLSISSREVRQRILEKRSFRYYLPRSVFTYIEENHLYK
jgi:nicotinate-nucleotide adenylyltransferase